MSRFTNSPLFHAPYQLWSTSDWSRVSTTTSNIATCGGKVAISKATSASSSTVIILRLSRIHTPFRKNISGAQATTCDAVIAAFQYRHVHQPHQPEFRGRTRRCPRSSCLMRPAACINLSLHIPGPTVNRAHASGRNFMSAPRQWLSSK